MVLDHLVIQRMDTSGGAEGEGGGGGRRCVDTGSVCVGGGGGEGVKSETWTTWSYGAWA
jgi:hypothetical protein